MKTKIIAIILGMITQAHLAYASLACNYQKEPCNAQGDHYVCYHQNFANMPAGCSSRDLSHVGGGCHHNMHIPCGNDLISASVCQSDSDCGEGQRCDANYGVCTQL